MLKKTVYALLYILAALLAVDSFIHSATYINDGAALRMTGAALILLGICLYEAYLYAKETEDEDA